MFGVELKAATDLHSFAQKKLTDGTTQLNTTLRSMCHGPVLVSKLHVTRVAAERKVVVGLVQVRLTEAHFLTLSFRFFLDAFHF